MEIKIKPNSLDRFHKLVITPELIEYDDTDWASKPITSFTRGEIDAFRYGVRFIRGYSFTIGRRYCIDIKNLDGRVLKIRFVSLYGIRKKILHEKFCRILTAFFETHHLDMLSHYLSLWNSGVQLNISGTRFLRTGIVLKGKEISWDDLGTKAYTTYYALFSKTDPKIYQSYSYLSDWNTALVFSISRQILRGKGFMNVSEE